MDRCYSHGRHRLNFTVYVGDINQVQKTKYGMTLHILSHFRKDESNRQNIYHESMGLESMGREFRVLGRMGLETGLYRLLII